METIDLIVKAKHFIDSTHLGNYTDCKNCPVANAAKEQFNTKNVDEWVDMLKVNKIIYTHKEYEPADFIEDAKKAQVSLPNDIIRIITLIKQ